MYEYSLCKMQVRCLYYFTSLTINLNHQTQVKIIGISKILIHQAKGDVFNLWDEIGKVESSSLYTMDTKNSMAPGLNIDEKEILIENCFKCLSS